jgi:hypothetical protein
MIAGGMAHTRAAFAACRWFEQSRQAIAVGVFVFSYPLPGRHY